MADSARLERCRLRIQAVDGRHKIILNARAQYRARKVEIMLYGKVVCVLSGLFASVMLLGCAQALGLDEDYAICGPVEGAKDSVTCYLCPFDLEGYCTACEGNRCRPFAPTDCKVAPSPPLPACDIFDVAYVGDSTTLRANEHECAGQVTTQGDSQGYWVYCPKGMGVCEPFTVAACP